MTLSPKFLSKNLLNNYISNLKNTHSTGFLQGGPLKVLVVGNGGREHAIAWKLALSSSATDNNNLTITTFHQHTETIMTDTTKASPAHSQEPQAILERLEQNPMFTEVVFSRATNNSRYYIDLRISTVNFEAYMARYLPDA